MAKKKQIQIDWTTAPEWANWFAVDEDGRGCFFSLRPYIYLNAWIWQDDSPIDIPGGRFDATNWRESLQERPKK